MTIITIDFTQTITDNLLSICVLKETDTAALLVVAQLASVTFVSSQLYSTIFCAAALQINNQNLVSGNFHHPR